MKLITSVSTDKLLIFYYFTAQSTFIVINVDFNVKKSI